MVAASKLRRAQEQAEASQPYAYTMAQMLARVSENVTVTPSSPKLLAGTGSDQRHLLIVVTADRGLCGGFNAYIVKAAKLKIKELQGQGKDVHVVCVGRKGRDALAREFGNLIKHSFRDVFGKNKLEFAQASAVASYVLDEFEAGTFDVCTLLYNSFQSVLAQVPTLQQLIPFSMPDTSKGAANDVEKKHNKSDSFSPYSFEPDEETILSKLLPRNVSVQIFRAMLDSAAGEQAARMTAMDNATRNAGDMINGLTLQYNRARQAYITKELIEIISGAEAV